MPIIPYSTSGSHPPLAYGYNLRLREGLRLMQAVIMCAGKSTRTAPLTLTRPKALLPILNRPLIEHQIEALAPLVDQITLVVGYLKEAIRAHCGDEMAGVRIRYVEQREQRGTGHAVLQCREIIEGDFLCLNGDDLYDPADLARLASSPQGALAKEVPDPRLYGIYAVDAEGNATRLEEKPETPFSNLANVGAYHLPLEVFDLLSATAPSPRGEIEITSAVQSLAEAKPFRVVTMEGYWLPIGYPWHLLDANAWFLRHRLTPANHGNIHPNASVDGIVRIGQGTNLHAGVVIEGPAFIGGECEIGPNCVIRGGSVVGNGCRIGPGVEVDRSVIFDGTAIAHLSYVGDSVIGSGVDFGGGTVTANLRHDGKTVRSMVQGALVDTGRMTFGAAMGDGVRTGVNTSILPGRKLWPGAATMPGAIVKDDMLTGTPAMEPAATQENPK